MSTLNFTKYSQVYHEFICYNKAMIDLSTIPPINIGLGKFGDIEITKDKHIYLLKHSGTEWHVYNTKNKREYCEQWSAYDLAYGDVLLSGFGFGQVATWIASKPKVSSVTVLEISQDVVDAFLSCNKMSEKIKIIIHDADTFTTSKKYDCVFFDHVSNGPKIDEFYKNLCILGKNISHDVFWFWSLEHYYLRKYYDIKHWQLYENPVDFKLFDFSTNWQQLINDFDMPTIPNLGKEKIDSYINAFFLRHLIQ